MERAAFRIVNRLRLNQKLFLSYLAVVIIPILVLGLYAYNQSKLMLDYQTLEGIEKNALTISDTFDSSLARYNNTVKSIVYNATFQKIVTNDYLDLVNLSRDFDGYLVPYFNLLKILDQDIKSITFYTQGNVPEISDLVQSSARVENEQWYIDAIQGPFNRYHWFYEDDLVVTAQFPRFFSSSATNVVHMKIDAQSFFNLSDAQDDSSIVMTDDQHRIVYMNRNAEDSLELEGADLASMQDGIVTIGENKLYLIKKEVRQTGWMLYYLLPAELTAQGAGSIIGATLGIVLVCLIILLIIISIFSKTMNRRVFTLNAMMKRVEMGDLSLRVQSDDRDEIGELTNRFGKMIVTLNELIDEAYRSKIVQKEAELKALQWQINPHFLYNTLSFINWKAVRRDAYDISLVVTSLSKFYRTALNRGHNVIPVRDELDNVKSYTEIIQMMSDNGFDAVFDIDESVYDFHTLNLILQPLVENAIRHGINQKTDGRGLLRVTARAGEGIIEFAVEDNGPGMPAETAQAILTAQSSGYGLKNVNERLLLKFGQPYGISVTSVPERGTTMTVIVPQYIESRN